jgi:ribose 5-phosphate isomerase A
MTFIPTGDQSKQMIIEAGLNLGSIDSLPLIDASQEKIVGKSERGFASDQGEISLRGKRQSLDVAFDGADEIDEDLNCIKGGGACLF